MANTTLKVITKKVIIEDEEFVLVELTRTDDGNRFFGTIPYSELDEKGCMKRELNGFEMCINETIARAIDMRHDVIKTRGMNEAQLINYYMNKM